jgi:spoIIIJ-associated protein
MEWVETTGRTIEEALDAALDELGVDVDDVEYEVLVEPRAGLFGRLGASEARLRARVKPLSREKPGDRRRRSRKQQSRGGRGPGAGSGAGGSAGGEGRSGSRSSTATVEAGGDPAGPASTGTGRSRRRGRGGSGRARSSDSSSAGGTGGTGAEASATTGERTVDEASVTIDQQAEAAGVFTRGLIEAWGASARVDVRVEDDENVLVDVTGDQLGLLVGPKGATLKAIEELVRTVVQRQTEGHGVRIHVDVGGYQAKRRAALESFVQDLAHKVLESGRDHALEPMTPADRKVVHDAVSDIDGVTTISEGEEPRRRVVLRRAGG